MSHSHGCPHQGVCSTVPADAHFRAVAELSGLAALRATTLNHHNVGIDALPQVSLAADAVTALQAALAAADVESFVLATCNRTEIYWRARVPGDDECVRDIVFAHVMPVAAETIREHLPLRGRAAAAHLFRVCCGIESLVLGEAEILGQVRAALDTNSASGPFLQGVVLAALRAGRMARAETRIGLGALSVASAAVQLVAATMPLAQSRVVVVGAGATGLKAARHLRALGVAQLSIANRTRERADAVAQAVTADTLGLDGLIDEIARADAAICAVAAPTPVIDRAALEAVMAGRPDRPLLVVDLSMPPVVEAGEVAGVTRVDLGALEQQVAQQRDRRASEIPGVEAVIERELHHLQGWARRHALRPFVSDLRRKAESIRQVELARAAEELSAAGATDVRVLERLSRRLLDQVLAIPFATLEAGELPLDAAQAQYLRRLFALGPGADA
jgi:glutamyl-tRNA reductase